MLLRSSDLLRTLSEKVSALALQGGGPVEDVSLVLECLAAAVGRIATMQRIRAALEECDENAARDKQTLSQESEIRDLELKLLRAVSAQIVELHRLVSSRRNALLIYKDQVDP